MEVEKPEARRVLRIVSGPVAVVEAELNLIGSEYVAQMWNWAVVNNELIVSVVMISAVEVRKQQIALAAVNPNGRR